MKEGLKAHLFVDAIPTWHILININILVDRTYGIHKKPTGIYFDHFY